MSTEHQSDDHHNHHGPQSFWLKYVFSTDHKVIGIQFMFTSLMFVVIGGLLALGVRYEIAWPRQDVPHVKLLPLDMTGKAPEANIALWQVGEEVEFGADAELDGNKYPAQTKATLKSFPKGIAVVIPRGTRVEGKEFPLGSDMDGWVDPSDVMADYNYKFLRVRAVAGTRVYEHPDGLAAAKEAGNEPKVLIAGPETQVYADPVLLPIRRDATTVVIQIHEQTVPPDAKEGEAKTDIAGIKLTLSAMQVNQIKESLTTDAYGQLFTMHASIMIFFVIIPMLVGAFGNFLIPLMIGAKDMAFPKLNMLSYWLAMPAGIIMIISFWVENGPSGGGWTMYPPLSDVKGAGESFVKSNLGTTLWIVSVGLVGFSSIVGALNYITTSINMRCPGMTLTRMPLTVWSILITSILALMGTPVLTATAILLLLDRTIGTQFFLDTMLISETVEVGGQMQETKKLVAAGGQPLMWQHLFWFYSHPAVYIMILPAMGLTSDILATFARKPIFGYKPMVWAMGAITGLGFIVWGHHMFQSGMNPVLGTTFMASTIMIAVPSAIKTFNWLGTLWGGNIKFTPSMLFAIGFVSMFVIGGLSGIFMASAPVDIHIHDTYFIVAHIHYVLFGGSLMGIFAGVYHWFPKMFGLQLNQRWGVIHFIMTLIAFNGTFFLMHILGIGGHPRRYASIMEYPTLTHLQGMNVFMTICAMMLGTAQIPFIYNVFTSLPRKLGRAMVAFMIAGLGAPIIAGHSHWMALNGTDSWLFGTDSWLFGTDSWLFSLFDTFLTTQTDAGQSMYSGFAKAIGVIALFGTLIMLLVAFLRGLTRGGKIAAIIVIPLFFIWPAIQFIGFGSDLLDESGALVSGENVKFIWTIVPWLVSVPFEAETAKALHDFAICVGHSFIFMGVVMAVTWVVWDAGKRISAVQILNRLMYVIFLPAFLAPAILKQDTFLWLDGLPIIGAIIDPSWFDAKWLILAATALPGLAYLVLFKPADRYGYDVGTNPWEANSLEWVATTSPPLAHGNFEEIPTVYRGPYEYSSPAVEEDWLPQTRVLPAGVREPEAH